MRNIGEVMDACLNIIPEDFENRGQIEKDFKRLANDVAYTAPEIMSDRWGELSMLLYKHAPPDKYSENEWCITLCNVVSDTEDHTPYLKKQTNAAKKTILNTVDDLVSGFLYYDRKEDDELPINAIQTAIKSGVITADEIIGTFKTKLLEGL